jgi:hypothetical protein
MHPLPVKIHVDLVASALDGNPVWLTPANLFRERNRIGNLPFTPMAHMGPQGVGPGLKLGRMIGRVSALKLEHYAIAFLQRSDNPSRDPLPLNWKHHLELKPVIVMSLTVHQSNITA